MAKSVHPAVVPYTYDAVFQRMVDADTRNIKAAGSLEADKRNKQLRANQLYADKLKAEERGDKDLAAKLERDYKETMREREKIQESLNRPLERRQRQELHASAELRVMTGVDVILSTLSSCLNQVPIFLILILKIICMRFCHSGFFPSIVLTWSLDS